MKSFYKARLNLVVQDSPKQLLRSATEDDLEQLRLWKNANRQFFFHQEEISEEQQKAWFYSYQKRSYDLMFMTEFECQPFGCMGIRWQDKNWDIYNIILGKQNFGKQGLMGKSFQTMLSYAYSLKSTSITLKVLKTNPAAAWYQKQGFRITEDNEDYVSMLHDKGALNSKVETKS